MDKLEHFEIPADDVERAIKFYDPVFKWELNPVPGVGILNRFFLIECLLYNPKKFIRNVLNYGGIKHGESN